MLSKFFKIFKNINIAVSGIIAWLVLYVIVGSSAAPGGHLFGLVVLVVAANFGGFLMSLTSLPRLIGMLATGILLQVFFFNKKTKETNNNICMI